MAAGCADLWAVAEQGARGPLRHVVVDLLGFTTCHHVAEGYSECFQLQRGRGFVYLRGSVAGCLRVDARPGLESCVWWFANSVELSSNSRAKSCKVCSQNSAVDTL